MTATPAPMPAQLPRECTARMLTEQYKEIRSHTVQLTSRGPEVIFHFSMTASASVPQRPIGTAPQGIWGQPAWLERASTSRSATPLLMYASDFATAGFRSASGPLLLGTSWVMFGRAAVAVFIVLSGYCLMLPIVQLPRQEWRVAFWPFIWRRAWRILPPYYGALACSAALIVLVPSLDDPSIGEWHREFPAFGTGSVVKSHLLLVHNYFPAYQYAIDHPLWSIATEWQIYFLFPLFVWIGKRRGDFSIVVTAGAITMALNLYLLTSWPHHNPWPPQFIGLFGFGMACAAWSFPRGSPAVDAQRWRRQATVLLGAGAVANVVFAATRQQQLPDLLVGGGIGCAMVSRSSARC